VKRFISIFVVISLLLSFAILPVSASGLALAAGKAGTWIAANIDKIMLALDAFSKVSTIGSNVSDIFSSDNPEVTNYYTVESEGKWYENQAALTWSCVPSASGYLRMTYSYLSELCLDLQNLGCDAKLYQLPRQSVEGWFQSDQRGWVIVFGDDSLIQSAAEVGAATPYWSEDFDGYVFKITDDDGAYSDVVSHIGHRHALTNNAGNILYAPFENNDTMISNDGRHYYTDNTHSETNNNTTNNYYQGGDTTTNNVYNHETNKIFDYTNGQWWDVGELYYDASSKTYTANYQTHVGDVYYDYSMHWTYNIDYTSITYLGSSETYDIYNIYYELPDGRSSADLTAEDLEQLNLEYDVINYGLNCDDASLRALYHFDGDTQDSSYWSAYSNFDWNKGASINYLEANEGFEGCLYLDESVHQFSVTLPSALSYKDFSVLFRYYQMDTLNTDVNTFSIIAGEVLASLHHDFLPVGSWMEVGLIRHNGKFRVYVNGIPAVTLSNTKVYTDKIRFTFGPEVQCVRYFDELRVFDYAIVEDGADYTPIVQAQTTNLVLSLPGEARPIPDEYWNFNSDGNLFPLYDLVNDSDLMDMVFTTECESPYFSSSGLQLGPTGSKAPYYTSGEEGVVYQDGSGYRISLFASDKEIATDIVSEYCLPGYICGATYTFSVLLSDGTLCSLTFSDREVTQEFSFGCLSFYCFEKQSSTFYTDIYSYVVAIQPKVGAEIVYWELVPGSEANEGHEKVSVVYDPLDLDGPTIAIRSQIPVNVWKLGGVRPTIPERGDVWCGIQSSSIYTSQIYNGFAWVECEIRIWTDKERWVSAAYYNILTQQDFYDIQGTTDKEHLQTQQGFYTWFQTQWKQLLEILQTIDSRIEKLGTNSSSGVDLNFNIDGSIDVTFSKLADDGRKGILKVAFTFWELIFVDVWGSAGEALDNMAIVYGRDKTEFTIDGESGWTVWSIISPIKEDLWE